MYVCVPGAAEIGKGKVSLQMFQDTMWVPITEARSSVRAKGALLSKCSSESLLALYRVSSVSGEIYFQCSC